MSTEQLSSPPDGNSYCSFVYIERLSDMIKQNL